jgi:hypothetical protein
MGALSACATFSPTPMEQVPFKERAQTATRDGVTVTAAVLSAEEARAVFDSKLYKKGIQPIWIEIVNRSGEQIAYLPRSTDPFYFSALEAAQKVLGGSRAVKAEKRRFFYESRMEFMIPDGATVSGFVFGNRNKGVRWVPVEVFSESRLLEFAFVFEVPGFRADYHKLEADDIYGTLYPGREIVDITGLAELRAWVEDQPCCTENAKGTRQGDPLNIVIIGTDESVWPAFLRSGWDPTNALTAGSALKTGLAGVFGGAWRYSPISNLYVWGRAQDIALQKVRSNIHYRNHLRLWLAPVTYRGQGVLLGQISRDIGTRITTKSPTLTTHRIDPDVDDTRASLVQDFLYENVLAGHAAAGGVGAASAAAPRQNLTGDIYFTDGRRAVLMLSADPVEIENVEWIEWTEER